MTPKEQLKKAFDSNSLNGKLVMLNEEQATAFIDGLKDESVLLKNCRLITPSKSKTTIAKIFPNGRLLQPSTPGQKLADEKKGELGTGTVDIDCQGVKATIFVTDEEMMNNIEGGNFEDTMISLVQKKLANELEENALYGRKRSSGSANSTLELFSGWLWRLKQGGNVVNANDSSKFTNRLVEKAKFKSAIKSLPTRFRSAAKFIVGSDVMLDYQSAYDTVADVNVRNELMSTIMKKKVIEAPLMGNETPVAEATVYNIVSHTAGTKTYVLTDETGLVSGDKISISFGTTDAETFTVDTVTALTHTITVEETESLPHVADQKIRVVSLDGSEAILTDPLNLIFAMQKNEMSFEVERVAGVGRNYIRKYYVDAVVEEATAGTVIENFLTQD